MLNILGRERRIAKFHKGCWDMWLEKMDTAAKAEEDAAKVRSRQAWLDNVLEQAKLGERYKSCTLTNFEPVKGTEKALQVCNEYVLDFGLNDGEGLILTGATGCGKSHLAAGIVHAMVQQEVTAVFQGVPELLARLRSTFDKDAEGAGEGEIMEALRDADLLVLDDVGAEKVSEWTQERLYLLIDGRYRDKKAIILTTNLEPKALEQVIGTRAMDRLLETCKIVKVNAASYRRRAKSE